MHSDLIDKFEKHVAAHALWDAIKLKFGGTSAIRLCSLYIKFEYYEMRPNHTMKQHLRAMSTMTRELKATNNTFTED